MRDKENGPVNIEELWGISSGRIREFFLSQKDVIQTGENSFSYQQAVVMVTPLPDKKMGSIIIPQTRVTVSGEEGAEEIHRRFELRFLSAGG